MHKNASFLLLDPSLPKSGIQDGGGHTIINTCVLYLVNCSSLNDIICIICNSSDSHLVTCRNTKLWKTLYRTPVLRSHKVVLAKMSSLCFSTTPVNNHRSCRSEFTHKRDLQAETSAKNNKNDPPSRRSSRDATKGQSAVLSDCCIFLSQD